MTLDERIAMARRHVESGRRIVERQRALVARIGSQSSIDLLGLFESIQHTFEADLADLLKEKGTARI
jgi:hypothetical protein